MTHFTTEQAARDAADIIAIHIEEWQAEAGQNAQVVQWPIEQAVLVEKMWPVIQEAIEIHVKAMAARIHKLERLVDRHAAEINRRRGSMAVVRSALDEAGAPGTLTTGENLTLCQRVERLGAEKNRLSKAVIAFRNWCERVSPTTTFVLLEEVRQILKG